MGRLRGIAILLTFSLGRALALGAPPESPASPAEPAPPQEQAPEKPSALEFVKAGAYLFNKGQLDKATSYFKAADRYRDQLTENEEIVLEVYLEKVETFYKNRKAEANATGVAQATAKAAAVAEATAKAAMAKATATDPTASPVDAAVAPASTTALAPARLADSVAPLAPLAPSLRGTNLPQTSRIETSDPKQKARWLLNESREQMGRGNYTEAAKKIAEARALDVKWGFLEESPDKVAKLLQKVMAKAPNGPATPTVRPLGVRAVPETNTTPTR